MVALTVANGKTTAARPCQLQRLVAACWAAPSCKRQLQRFLALGRRPHVASTRAMFDVVGPIVNVETIAAGREIRELPRLRKAYGKVGGGSARALVEWRLQDGSVHTAEIHWYEAHGIGRKEHKIKKFLR